MGRMMSYEFLLLVFVTFVSSIVSVELSPGAEKCFNDKMVGTKRRVKVAFCPTDGKIYRLKFSPANISLINIL